MIDKLKGISDDKKRLLSNFFSLSFLQGANYLLPLITLPYLVFPISAGLFIVAISW
jgi:PST family polysaccharide transporter